MMFLSLVRAHSNRLYGHLLKSRFHAEFFRFFFEKLVLPLIEYKESPKEGKMQPLLLGFLISSATWP